MSVTLRKKAISKGRKRFYLDFYSEGVRKYETLKEVFIYTRPKTDSEKQHNKDNTHLAETYKSKKELQINSSELGLETIFKQRINMVDFFQKFANNYSKKDNRLVTSCLRYFKEFAKSDTLKPFELNEQFCIDFKEFLESKLNGETPANYFSKFKKMLKQAVREKIYVTSPAAEVVNKKSSGLTKDILSSEEIQTLFKAQCGNKEVQRAFLFACFTGLRFCDIKILTWGNINGNAIRIKSQTKTDKPVIINLNLSASYLLGEPGEMDSKIFMLPSHNAVLDNLSRWAVKAGVQKHITFHVARHSFATNLLIADTDLISVASLLGHTSTRHTEKYTRIVEALKEQGVNRLPQLQIT